MKKYISTLILCLVTIPLFAADDITQLDKAYQTAIQTIQAKKGNSKRLKKQQEAWLVSKNAEDAETLHPFYQKSILDLIKKHDLAPDILYTGTRIWNNETSQISEDPNLLLFRYALYVTLSINLYEKEEEQFEFESGNYLRYLYPIDSERSLVIWEIDGANGLANLLFFMLPSSTSQEKPQNLQLSNHNSRPHDGYSDVLNYENMRWDIKQKRLYVRSIDNTHSEIYQLRDNRLIFKGTGKETPRKILQKK